MKRDDILRTLKNNMDELERFGVKRIGIFGSFARNEAGEESDVDIIVEFEEERGGFEDFGGLVEFLEKLFKREVDILTPVGIETIRIRSVKERIKKEVLYV
jgi:predicted nucleotidyltransferase